MTKHPHMKKIIFTEEQIVNKCKELAKWIDQEYKDKPSLILLGLLNGSMPFLAELIKHVTIPMEYTFMRVSSYHGGTASTGRVKVLSPPTCNLTDRHILVIDEIVDTGVTLQAMESWLNGKVKAASVKTMALIDKKEGRTVEYNTDIYGFDVEKVFLVGFGLDINEKLRNLPYVGEFDQSYLDEYK